MRHSAALVCAFIMMLSFAGHSQPVQYWARCMGGAAADEGMDISIDKLGNTYTTGYFSGTTMFGTAATLTSHGITDIFVTKLDKQGQVIWAVQAGGAGPDRGLSIRADDAGNSYVTGYYSGSAQFGSVTVVSAGLQDIFIAKYDPAGVLQWVTSAGGSDNDIGNAINIDPQGNVIVTGQFVGKAFFGGTALTSMVNPSTGTPSIDVFVCKTNAAGAFQWAKKGTAPKTDRGLDIASDHLGNVYVTGQFSDTITFDSQHLNNLFNSIFLIKYSPGGTEQWFRRIGGGSQNIAYGIASDKNDNLYVTGDFIGNLIFFSSSNTIASSLTSPYSNGIFVAKYDKDGTLIWDKADGSSSEVSSRNIAVDDSSSAYIVGLFTCKFSSYADRYGQSTFNSVGFHDIFVAKYNASGAWQWSRQCGGPQEDYGSGIAVGGLDQTYFAGSFNDRIVFPFQAGMQIFADTWRGVFSGSQNICGDLFYSSFRSASSNGNSDIVIAQPFTLSRQPFDFYAHKSTACVREPVKVCINNNGNDNICEKDTITACVRTTITAASNTSYSSPGINSPGPDFTYLWSTGATARSIDVLSSGRFAVTITSADNCISSSDSIYVKINPNPLIPGITDSKGVNINSTTPQSIHLCKPDSVVLTGDISNATSYSWNGVNKSSITVKKGGTYNFLVKNKYGCSNINTIVVNIDTTIILKPIKPKLKIVDSVVCSGNPGYMYLYDSIANPLGFNSGIPHASYSWTVTPVSYYKIDTIGNSCSIYTLASGWFHLHVVIKLQGMCGTIPITYNFDDSVHIRVNPKPIVNVFVNGNFNLCPGDSTMLTASGAKHYAWYGPGIFPGTKTPSIQAKIAGNYSVYSSDTTAEGCIGSASAFAQVVVKSPPSISMNPSTGLICPGSAVVLTVNGIGSYQWIGPFGPISSNTQSISVNAEGFYYCIFKDTDGCSLATNTVEVKQYATPLLLASPSAVLCQGGSVTVSLVTNAGSIVQWDPPLSGSSLSQTISAPGTYTCQVISCGIHTNTSITISNTGTAAVIVPDGPLRFCEGDSVTLHANNSVISYKWTSGSPLQNLVVKNSGTFQVTITDVNGCSSESGSLSVIVDPKPHVVADLQSYAGCQGDIVSFSGSGAVSYLWNGVVSGSIYSTQSVSITALASDKYILTGTGPNGCKARDTVDIQVNPVPVFVTGPDTALCAGADVHLGKGNDPSYTYSWQPIGSALPIPVVLNPPPGSYVYTVTVTNGHCIRTGDVNVKVNPLPVLGITFSSIVCAGDSVQLGNPTSTSYTYSWAPSAGLTMPKISEPFASPSVNTTYVLTVTDPSSNCSVTQAFPVDVSLTLLSIPPAVKLCKYDSVYLNPGGNASYSYSWSPSGFLFPGPNAVDPRANPLSTTTYMVRVQQYSSNGKLCSIDKTVVVDVSKDTVTLSAGNDTTLCKGASLLLHARGSGGASRYLWSVSPSFSNPLNLPSDSLLPVKPQGPFTRYYIKAGNDYCMKTDSILLNVDSVLMRVDPVGICPGHTDTIRVLNLNNVSLSYLWVGMRGILSPTNTGKLVVSPSVSTVYTAIVSDARGCTAEDSTLVRVHPVISLQASADKGSIFRGESVFLHPGSTKAYSYTWYPPVSLDDPHLMSPKATPTATTTYTLTVIDTSGHLSCSASDSLVIRVREKGSCDDPFVFVPNAFTPDGDGKNDVLYVRGSNISTLSILIYDRWGQKMAEISSLSQGWDGMYNGKPAPPAVYVYYMKVKCLDEAEPVFRKGNITLVR